MRCNWWRWLWGIIPLLILGWIAVEAEHTRLERDLAARTAQALKGAGLAWAATGFQGRDGVLSGRASDVSDPDKAMSLLTKVWGVRVMENKSDLIEQVENYVWFASRRNNRVRLTGYVPNPSARQLVLGMARANFPGFEIQDRMKLARGVPSIDAWLGAVSFGLKQMTLLKSGDMRLDGTLLFIGGEAEDATAYRTLRSSLGSGMPKTIKISGVSIQPPTVSPHVWTAKFNGSSMAFAGHVPSDTDQAAILSAGRESLNEKSVTDDSEPGAGTPQGWSEAALLAVRQLRKLESGNAEIKDGVLTLTGIATDETVAAGIRNALKTLPASIKLNDGLQVKPPPKPVEPPPPPEPQAVPPEPLPPIAAPAPPSPPPPPPMPVAPEPAPPVAPAPPAPPEATPPPPKMERKAEPPKSEQKADVPKPPPAAPAPPATPIQRAAKACQENLRDLAAAGTILFRYASADLSPESSGTLNKIAAAAKDCPQMTISIEGYASAEGSAASNLRLSQTRARSVLDYLVKAGVDAKQLEARGFGIERPVAPNSNAENMAKNRRIEFSVRPAGTEYKPGGR